MGPGAQEGASVYPEAEGSLAEIIVLGAWKKEESSKGGQVQAEGTDCGRQKQQERWDEAVRGQEGGVRTAALHHTDHTDLTPIAAAQALC